MLKIIDKDKSVIDGLIKKIQRQNISNLIYATPLEIKQKHFDTTYKSNTLIIISILKNLKKLNILYIWVNKNGLNQLRQSIINEKWSI